MMSKLPRISATVAAMALAFTSAVAMAQEEAPAEEAVAPVGEPAPPFELTDIAGETHRLSDYEGQIVVIHFQSPSCPWEQNYQPYLSEWAGELTAHTDEDGEPRVVFLAINSNDNESLDLLRSYHEEREMPYTILKDEGAQVARQYAATHTPHIFVIDEEQVLRYRGGVEQLPPTLGDVGQMEEQYLVPVVTALLNGEEPEHTNTRSKGCTIKFNAS